MADQQLEPDTHLGVYRQLTRLRARHALAPAAALLSTREVFAVGRAVSLDQDLACFLMVMNVAEAATRC